MPTVICCCGPEKPRRLGRFSRHCQRPTPSCFGVAPYGSGWVTRAGSSSASCSLHGRELALAALWLDEDGPQALALARGNLRLQREPLDWWVALQSAKLAKDSAALAELEKEIRATGLRDARLTSASAASPKGVK